MATAANRQTSATNLDPSRVLRYARDPAAFRNELLIEQRGKLVPFGSIMDDWQREDFAACDAGWIDAVRGRPSQRIRRAYLERPRGHSKSTDLAVMIAWALAFAPRHISGFAAAADEEQAGLLRKKVAQVVRWNPWLEQFIEVQQKRISNIAKHGHDGNESELVILASDAASSFGLTPDFVICDELTHWSSNSDFWDSLISSASKREWCFLVAITNAGLGAGKDSVWQWRVREHFRTSERCYFSRLDGPRASWLSAEDLEEQRKLLLPRAYARLWGNEWQADTGEALSETEVRDCVTLPGPSLGYGRQPRPYLAGLDLGLKHDRSALVVVGLDCERQRVEVASVETWAPLRETGKVRLGDVEAACLKAQEKFGLLGIVFDPWQAALMAERLAAAGVRMSEWPFVPANLDAMATTLLQAVTNQTLGLFDHPGLIGDLLNLVVTQSSKGAFRLKATRNELGHADAAMALAIALPTAFATLDGFNRQAVYERYGDETEIVSVVAW